MTADKTLNELTELLRTATTSAEQMIDEWQGFGVTPELLSTIQKANKLLQILDENKALTEGTV